MKLFKKYLKEIGYKEYAEANIKYSEAVDNWYKDLREEWKCMSDDIFNACYRDACYRAADSNKRNKYDEIANNFGKYSLFVNDIINIVLLGKYKT